MSDHSGFVRYALQSNERDWVSTFALSFFSSTWEQQQLSTCVTTVSLFYLVFFGRQVKGLFDRFIIFSYSHILNFFVLRSVLGLLLYF